MLRQCTKLRCCRMALVLFAALCLTGCALINSRCEGRITTTQPPHLARSAAETALVEALWAYHESAITDVLEGIGSGKYRYYGSGSSDFDKALDFFEIVTGIPSNTGATFGRLITPDLGTTLILWQQWYRENRSLLRFDAAHCEITRLEPTKP